MRQLPGLGLSDPTSPCWPVTAASGRRRSPSRAPRCTGSPPRRRRCWPGLPPRWRNTSGQCFRSTQVRGSLGKISAGLALCLVRGHVVCATGVAHACSLFGARLLSRVIRSRLAARAAASSSSRSWRSCRWSRSCCSSWATCSRRVLISSVRVRPASWKTWPDLWLSGVSHGDSNAVRNFVPSPRAAI
jgi:hypothetical protein